MPEVISAAGAFLHRQETLRLPRTQHIPERATEGERVVSALVKELIDTFGIGSCIFPIEKPLCLLSKRHPLGNAVSLTPLVTTPVDGSEVVLQAGYIPVPRVGRYLPDVSYRVVADSGLGRSRPLTLLNVDDLDRVRDRFRRRLSSEDLAGGADILRSMIEHSDPNARAEAERQWITAIAKAPTTTG